MYVSQVHRYHSPSAPLKAALASTAYDKHARALDALKKPLDAATAELLDAKTAAANAAAELADALLSITAAEVADKIDASTRETAHAAEAELTASAKVKLLEATEERLGTELDQIILNSRDILLRHLNGTLQDAYAESRLLGLQSIHDAEHAISAGKANEWQRMVELRTTIFNVRDAQALIVGRLGTHEAIQRYKTFGLLRNYAELWPAWLEAGTGAVWGRENLRAPWPTDPVEFHAWILSNDDAEPWVPTEAELLAAVKEAQTEARASAHSAHTGQDA